VLVRRVEHIITVSGRRHGDLPFQKEKMVPETCVSLFLAKKLDIDEGIGYFSLRYSEIFHKQGTF